MTEVNRAFYTSTEVGHLEQLAKQVKYHKHLLVSKKPEAKVN